jgi:hypothetical protein
VILGRDRKSQITNHKSVAMQIERILQTAALSLLAACAALHARTPQLEPKQPQPPAAPTVTFTLEWPRVEPHRYVISVESSGNAVYRSWRTDPAAAQSSADDPYLQKFAVSAAARERIFALASQLNYFDGDFEYRKHRVASTGDKTLAYADSGKQYVTHYNWSENSGISELTALFQGMSAAIESGRRLEHLYRFDRLGLDEELKNLESLAAERQAAELQVIAPILEQLAQDPAVLNIARQRARHILQMAGVPSAGNGQTPR